MNHARSAKARWLCLACAAGLLLWWALSNRALADAVTPPTAPPDVSAQVARGQALYAFHCTTCHGATGAGFAEARAAFPSDHYDCSRCHGPNNPPQMSQASIDASQSVFSLGDPPAVNDATTLQKYGSALGLFHYVRATMPRWSPGYVSVYEGSEEAYVDIVAFVLTLAELHPMQAPLTMEGLLDLRFD